MDDKKQGSKLCEIIDLTDEFVKKADVIYKGVMREVIKNNGFKENLGGAAGFGLSCVMLHGKVSEWMKGISEEVEILEREKSGKKEH